MNSESMASDDEHHKNGANTSQGFSEAAPHYAGHRERVKRRFDKGGEHGLEDYELLELVLFQAIPRRDVKPIAKELINRFGSFAETLTAPPKRLLEVKGIGSAVIHDFKLIEAAAKRITRARIMGKPMLSAWSDVIDYCHTAMAFAREESFRVLFLDRKNRLIADEQQQTGTVDHTPVYPREIVKRALELSASAIILVHNHPSGDPSPSPEDLVMTRKIIEAAEPLSIAVHDHIIVGKSGCISFRAQKLI